MRRWNIWRDWKNGLANGQFLIFFVGDPDTKEFVLGWLEKNANSFPDRLYQVRELPNNE